MQDQEIRGVQIDAFEQLEHQAVKAQSEVKKKEALFLKIINMGLEALSRQVLKFAALAAATALFAWCMIEPTVIRTATATVFVCTTFLPILFREKDND